MTRYLCVLVFRDQQPDYPTAILGPFDNDEAAMKAKYSLPDGFWGITWRMDIEVRP